MSMQSNPNSGYIIEMRLLRPIVPEQHLARFDELINKATPSDEWEEFLELARPTLGAWPSEVMILQDDDYSSELKLGVYYAVFDESVLYEKKPTPEARELINAIGTIPERQEWTVFS